MNRDQFLETTVEDGAAFVSIDRPPLNVLGFSQFERVCTSILELIGSREVRVVVLAGTADAFGSGFDIKEIEKCLEPERMKSETTRIKVLLMKMEAATKPIIAAIRGICFGGGLELAMACHLRIAASDAKMGVPEIKLATIPTLGGTVRLPRIVGRAHALELLLTGKIISGQDGFSMGLVNEVCKDEEVMTRATGLARTIAEKGRLAVEAAVQVVDGSMRLSLSEAMDLESEVSGRLIGTHDLKEGVTAFFERRKPVFTHS
jgi:enoyl-CoA hydratase/carnithine racemase